MAWGVDSVDTIDTAINSVRSYFSTAPVFYGRYLHPTVYTGLEQDSATEASAAHNNGIANIFPITNPASVSATAQTAQAQGNQVCGNIRSAINNANYHLALPTGMQLRVYLDVEANTTFTASYWNAWAGAVDNYYDSASGYYAYFPSCYCNPSDIGVGGSNPCSILDNSSNLLCAAIWSSVPAYNDCTNCSIPGPAWGSQKHCSSIYTVIWQYGEYNPANASGSCTHCSRSGQSFPHVDLDQSTPGENELSYMLRVQ